LTAARAVGVSLCHEDQAALRSFARTTEPTRFSEQAGFFAVRISWFAMLR
jgi:hypothetical protein